MPTSQSVSPVPQRLVSKSVSKTIADLRVPALIQRGSATAQSLARRLIRLLRASFGDTCPSLTDTLSQAGAPGAGQGREPPTSPSGLQPIMTAMAKHWWSGSRPPARLGSRNGGVLAGERDADSQDQPEAGEQVTLAVSLAGKFGQCQWAAGSLAQQTRPRVGLRLTQQPASAARSPWHRRAGAAAASGTTAR